MGCKLLKGYLVEIGSVHNRLLFVGNLGPDSWTNKNRGDFSKMDAFSNKLPHQDGTPMCTNYTDETDTNSHGFYN